MYINLQKEDGEMKDIQIRQIFRNTAEYAEQEVVVRGWIRTNRGSNKFGFIELNDGTFFKSIQVVYEKEIIDNFQEISKAPISAALMVRGTLALTPEAQVKITENLEVESVFYTYDKPKSVYLCSDC